MCKKHQTLLEELVILASLMSFLVVFLALVKQMNTWVKTLKGMFRVQMVLLINSWFILLPLPGRAPCIRFALSHKQQLPHLTLLACLPLKYTDSHDSTAVMPAIPPWIWSHSPESAHRPLIPRVYSPCRVPCCAEGNFREVMEHASFPGGVQEVYTPFRGLAFWFSTPEAAKEHLPWLWLACYSHLDMMLWALLLWNTNP